MQKPCPRIIIIIIALTKRAQTNSARRIKCDEAKPDCQRCLKSGHTCRGYSVAAPAQQKRPFQLAVAIAPDIAREYQKGHATRFGPVEAHSQTLPRRVREAEPPDWDYIESFRYCKFLSPVLPSCCRLI